MTPRSRPLYAASIAVVTILGLCSRRYAGALPGFFAEYSGDTLWALLVFLLIGFCFPRRPTWQVALAALLFSFAIEISQLYRAPWIDAIRRTTPGGLILGFGFLWSDLVCYTSGVTLGVAAEILRQRSPLPLSTTSS